MDGFLGYFRTPVLKATLGRDTRSFYTVADYERWRTATPNAARYTTKWYKGLGTNTSLEAREYFSRLQNHLGTYALDGDVGSAAIQRAFDPKRANDRKTWIASVGEDALISDSFETELAGVVPLSNFVDRKLVLYGIADNRRSIPSAIDGLKPSQRKVLFACFARKIISEIKVAQLAGYVAERTHYAHGEAALTEVIMGMTRDYVGASNLNILVPKGQFGTRHEGGKDSAASRYVYTHLSNVARSLFPADDDPLLETLIEDGYEVEPRAYVPVIPLLLVNGASGIGTGWACEWAPRDPRAVVRAVRALLAGEEPDLGPPCWRGFKGTVEAGGENRWVVRAPMLRDGSVVRIRDLPPGTWTTPYRAGVLDKGVEAGWITKYSSDLTDTTATFEVTLAGPAVGEDDAAVRKRLKLDETVAETLLVAWNAEGRLVKYQSPHEVLREHFIVRRTLYERRKELIDRETERDVERLADKEAFLTAVVEGRLALLGRPAETLRADAIALGIREPDPLFGLPLSSLSAERLAGTRRELAVRREDLARARATTADDYWRADLDRLQKELDGWGKEAAVATACVKKRAIAGSSSGSAAKRSKR